MRVEFAFLDDLGDQHRNIRNRNSVKFRHLFLCEPHRSIAGHQRHRRLTVIGMIDYHFAVVHDFPLHYKHRAEPCGHIPAHAVVDLHFLKIHSAYYIISRRLKSTIKTNFGGSGERVLTPPRFCPRISRIHTNWISGKDSPRLSLETGRPRPVQ